MRRFWNGRAADFETDELVAFFHTLPDEAATRKAVLGYEVSLNTMMNALMVDAIRELHMGFAKKKLKDDQRLFSSLDGTSSREKKEMEKIKEQYKKNNS